MNKCLIAGFTVLTLSVIGLAGAELVSAHGYANRNNFNKVEMQASHEERLNQAVTNGVISEDQKLALLEQHERMHEVREQNRAAHRNEMEAFFTQQGIDSEALHKYMGHQRGPKIERY